MGISGHRDALFGKTLSQLEEIVKEFGMPRFTAVQIADWMYKKDIRSIDEMSNISKAHRNLLSEKFDLGISEPVKVQTSIDGTKKYLYRSLAGKFIEAAYIPERNRNTLCVSSQVGCKMGCLFCMTGKQGFQGQLSAGEIVNQIRSLPERNELTNIVYMGMGEPFDNLDGVMQSLEILTSEWGLGMSPRRITVSTIGIIPAMKVFLEESKCHLAVSLHSPFEDERRKLMPIENVYSLPEVLSTIREFPLGKQRRISFEYIVFKGLNHSPKHVKELARILNGIRCRINLLYFHPIPDTPLEAPDEEIIQQFKIALENKGLTTTIRKSRGQDIYAACGMLSTKELQKKEKIN
ncbi:MAG: 23S rRNA (adenine(2503)-C(2))-methyltransferase RlmN [Bacteroidetes bacterium]|nr:MAG: 23S rRNA (adenine(2503)-C(2))-methyltransferase RlmN [Bacteroidota bacterium]